jgi:hypothetical protein
MTYDSNSKSAFPPLGGEKSHRKKDFLPLLLMASKTDFITKHGTLNYRKILSQLYQQKKPSVEMEGFFNYRKIATLFPSDIAFTIRA